MLSVEKQQEEADLGLSESPQGHLLPPQTSPGQGLETELERGTIPVSPAWSPLDGLQWGLRCQA